MSGRMPTDEFSNPLHLPSLHQHDGDGYAPLPNGEDSSLSLVTSQTTTPRVYIDTESNEVIDDLKVNLTLDGQPEGERAAWDNKFQYLLACISFAVGLGNVWRFPYLCQQNGGGAFLIPYVIMMFIEGMPVFLLEMGIGQRLRKGCIGVWNEVHPFLGGVGISSNVISFLVGLYYNVIITWCLFYLGKSFTFPDLPWKSCPQVEDPHHANKTTDDEECAKSSPTQYYWYRQAVQTTQNINDFGGINWQMLICLFAAWFIVWACVCKGIKTSGKVMYVTATFPYVVLFIFFIRAAILPGASKGLAMMITPEVSRLADPRVWLDAATQIFYSLSLAFGGIIAFSSYNPPKNNVMKDVFVLSGVNLFTSIFTAVVIFCILGFKGENNYNHCLEKEREVMQDYFQNMTLNFSTPIMEQLNKVHFNDTELLGPLMNDFNVTALQQLIEERTDGQYCFFDEILKKAGAGTGLAFIAFTEVIIEFPGSQFWSILFFLMLLSLGLGSMFGTLECCITSIFDLNLFPSMKKPMLTVGLLFVTFAGEYWVKLFDAFAGSYGLMAVAFFEVIGIVYVYGWRRFMDDIEFMTGHRPGLYWQICWRFVNPVIMITLFVASIVTSLKDTPTYDAYSYEHGNTEKKVYPPWALIVGGVLCILAICPVPIVFFIRKFKFFSLEKDIPVAVRNLDSTPSTVQILRSQDSMNGDPDSARSTNPILLNSN